MVLGCTSDAGKSLLTAALCRWFARRGEHVLPFKAQNMSNNAAVCRDGAEIGRAQWLQALAARAEPEARMNPVLLKPESHVRSQVVVLGRVDHELTRTPWLERRDRLWPVISGALDDLAARCDRVVMEGAGSPAEPNLMAYDLVNLAPARHLDAACYLVSDIDRGGSFAHLLGTWQALDPPDRARIRGFVLNKFRGDPTLLLDAREWLQARTGVPTVALVPWVGHRLPDEDGFFHRDPQRSGNLRLGLVMQPYASNLDEFDPLAHEAGVDLVPVRTPADLEGLSAVIIPGSKNTVASLACLRESGVAAGICRLAAQGIEVLGVCGGLQILGTAIRDPQGVEGGDAAGLGLLDLVTTFLPAKTTAQRTVACVEGGEVSGYEIHHGVSEAGPAAVPYLADGLGWRQGNVTGVYLHGICGDAAWRGRFLRRLGWQGSPADHAARVDADLDKLAELVDTSGWAADLAMLDLP